MPGSLKPLVLVINIGDDLERKLWDTKYTEFRSFLDRDFNITTATNANDALDVFRAPPESTRKQGRPPTPGTAAIRGLPKVVLVVSSGIFEPGHTTTFLRLHHVLASYVSKAGGTLLFCANVPAFMDRMHSNTILQKTYGLQWRIGTSGRFKMEKNNLEDAFDKGSLFFLAPEYHTMGLCLTGAPKDAQVYTVANDGESTDHLCMIIFEARECGRIGFVGDRNLDHELSSYEALMAMIEYGINNVFFDPTVKLKLSPFLTMLHKCQDICNVCLHPSGTAKVYCKVCKNMAYCSQECRRYDRTLHEMVCTQNSSRDLAKNKFSRLFPHITNNDREQAIVRLIDSYRIRLRDLRVAEAAFFFLPDSSQMEEVQMTAYEYLPIGIFEDDPVVKGFKKWIKAAKKVNALPVWWDECADREMMNYATWDHWNELGDYALWTQRIEGSLQGDRRLGGLSGVKSGADVFIGREITNAHLKAQYGEENGEEVERSRGSSNYRGLFGVQYNFLW